MIHINENFDKLQSSYLFSEIARRVREYQATNPPRRIIRLGIGDVTEPLPPVCLAAMHRAVGGTLGIKASGGIRDADTARAMIAAGATRLGLSGSRAVIEGFAE